ncbi:MAG: hypothetical protein HY059_18780 [Proteobacteria bacterium]|nr:hypothetical protein [Pseudomonadota bacterium]
MAALCLLCAAPAGVLLAWDDGDEAALALKFAREKRASKYRLNQGGGRSDREESEEETEAEPPRRRAPARRAASAIDDPYALEAVDVAPARASAGRRRPAPTRAYAEDAADPEALEAPADGRYARSYRRERPSRRREEVSSSDDPYVLQESRRPRGLQEELKDGLNGIGQGISQGARFFRNAWATLSDKPRRGADSDLDDSPREPYQRTPADPGLDRRRQYSDEQADKQRLKACLGLGAGASDAELAGQLVSRHRAGRYVPRECSSSR